MSRHAEEPSAPGVVLLSAVRTPVGRYGGVLAAWPPERLAAAVLEEAVRRAGVPKAAVDEVVLGWVLQSSESPNIARYAALLAGFPVSVTGVTVQRQCGSGLEAVLAAARLIRLGEADLVVAGGTESMSQAPHYVVLPTHAKRPGPLVLHDPFQRNSERSSPPGPAHLDMGVTAENLAQEFGIGRAEQDAFALRSHEKALAAEAAGAFQEERLPLTRHPEGGEPVERDEGPRPDTSLARLAALRPAFRPDGTVTAGNSCGLNDGAAALVLASEAWARANGRRPLARLLAGAVAGVEPERMGIGPVPALRKALARVGLGLSDLDWIEVNEAFAVQVLAVVRRLGLDPDDPRLNPHGGAIALGHPVGASGARIAVTGVYGLASRGGGRLATALCIGGGQGIAAIWEVSPRST
jgi:acetyl-CoA acetyltransferase family protein